MYFLIAWVFYSFLDQQILSESIKTKSLNKNQEPKPNAFAFSHESYKIMIE